MLGIIVMLVVFLTGFASAWTSSTFSENKELTLEKESLTKYGTYNIQKHAWYDPLKIFTEETIKSIELKTNTEQCIDCLSEGTIVLNKDGTLIDDLIWKRSFDEGKTFVDWRGYTNWKLLVEEDVDVFETTCVDGKEIIDEKNGTSYFEQDCITSKTGTTKQWNNLDFKKEYKAGTYNYKIEGSKKASVTYDWIIKTNGELLTNWAVWGAVIGVGGVEANITINSPANNSIVYSNPVTLNASGNVTGGAYLTNATLYDNSTGSWEARNSSIFGSINLLSQDTNSITESSATPVLRKTLSFSNDNIIYSNQTLCGSSNYGFTINSFHQYIYADGTKINTSTSSWNPLSSICKVFNYTNPNPSKLVTSINVWVWQTSWNPSYPCSEKDDLAYEIDIRLNKTQTFLNSYSSGDTILWNMEYCDSDGDCGFSETNRTFSIDGTAPTITLNYPTSLIDYGAVNGTLQLNFTATDTNLDYCGFGYYTTTSNKIKGYGNIYQNHTNFSLIAQLHRVVSGGNPQLRYTITIPANCKNNGKITLYDDDTNVSCIDTGGANVTLTPSVGGHGLLTKFFEVTPCSSGVPIVKNITLSQNKVAEFYANDTAGNLNTTTFSWDYRVLFLNASYDAVGYETQSQNFVSHINYNTNASLQVLLNYDSTNYTTTNTGSGSYGIYSPTTFEAPFVSADTNKTFFWIFIYNSSTTYSSELNQTVKPIFLILCNGTYTNKTLNYTFIDEATGIPINSNTNPVTFRSTFRYWFGSGLNYKNYSYQIINTTTTNNFSFCISPANYTFYTDIDLQYEAQDYSQRTLYERNESLTNVTQNISLYVLLSTSTQKFTIYLKQGIEPFTDVLTEVYKYFVGDGIYKLVTTGLSDDKGTFVANLNLDEQYKFISSKDGYTYDEQIKQASCSVAPCEITLNIGDVVLSAYEDFYNYFAQNVEYNLTYNKSSSIVTLQFLDKIGTAEYWRLWVYQTNFANDTLITICDENTYSISGTMTCNYSSYDGDITAKAYISRSPEKLVNFINFVNENITEILGLTGILASIIIFLVIVFSGIRNPVNIFILIPFAFVVLKFIGLLPLDWSWILALTIFDIWIIKRLKT
jgi:hypothetical protein